MMQWSDEDDDMTAIIEMKRQFKRNFSSKSHSDRNLISRLGNPDGPLPMQNMMEKGQGDKQRQLELIEAKALVTKLRKDITSLQTKYEETCVKHQHELSEMQQKCAADRQAHATVKTQLQKLLPEEEELRDKLRKTQAQLSQTTAEYQKKLLAQQEENYKLQKQMEELEQEAHSDMQELKATNHRKEYELNMCRVELSETKDELQQVLRKYNEARAQLQEAEKSKQEAVKTEQHVKELELKLSRLETEETIIRTMKNELDRLSSLEAENNRLKRENVYCKETQDNVFLLHEEKCDLKQKLARAEQKCVEINMLQTENKELKDELAKWKDIRDGNSKRCLSPKELNRRMTDLQHSNTALLERQGILQTSVHSLEDRLKNKESELGELQAKFVSEHAQVKESEQLIVRLKRKLLLVSKERDSYKSMVESYERETSTGKAQTVQRNIKQLQDTLRSYQNHVTNIETELEQKVKELSLAISKSMTLEAEVKKLKQIKPAESGEADRKVIAQLREQVASLEQSLEEIQIEKEKMQLKLDKAYIQGVFDPENTKVITMTVNPFSLARKRRHEEVENIMEDNKRLKTRLQVIEENQGDLEDITQKVSLKLQESGVDSQQIKEFQEQIRSAELKNQRLMEVFRKKSHELREVVYCLLGYMIQLPCDNQYKLLNMYAESPNDVLMFQKTESGELQLLETAYSSTLTEKMELYLTNGNSIPAFLSSITMDLFNQQTVLQ